MGFSDIIVQNASVSYFTLGNPFLSKLSLHIREVGDLEADLDHFFSCRHCWQLLLQAVCVVFLLFVLQPRNCIKPCTVCIFGKQENYLQSANSEIKKFSHKISEDKLVSIKANFVSFTDKGMGGLYFFSEACLLSLFGIVELCWRYLSRMCLLLQIIYVEAWSIVSN